MSQCNTASGQGSCDTDFGTCTCIYPPPTLSLAACNSSCSLGPNGLQCSGEGTCTYQPSVDDFRCVCNPGRSGDTCAQAGTGLVGLLEGLLYQGTAPITEEKLSTGASTTLFFTFFNPEPRCENQQGPYCAGAQLFTPKSSDGNHDVFHAFFPPQTQISYGPRGGNLQVPQDYANICVNSLDSSFNSSWIPANYLTSPLTSYTLAGNVPIACQDFRDTEGNLAYKYRARFTSNSNIPSQLQNKLFYTRCPEKQSYEVGDTNTIYIFQPINQFDSSGNLLFDMLDYPNKKLSDCP